MKLMPGSPFNDEKLNAAQKAIINEKYGLNDSLPVQYVHYLGKVVRGDFGVSFQYDNKRRMGINSTAFRSIYGNWTLCDGALVFWNSVWFNFSF